MAESKTNTQGVLVIALMLVVCIAMVGISFLLTPMNSGVPAAFGSFIQPLAWLLAAACTALVTVLSVPLLILVSTSKSEISGLGILMSFAFVVIVFVLLLDFAQLLFAIFGPDI
jgi:hypothetical protein